MNAGPPAPLIADPRTKLRLAGGAALLLLAGWLVAPRGERETAAPGEQAVPILQEQVQRREPARIFRGVQDIGRRALVFAIAFPGRPRTVTPSYADFAAGGPIEEAPPAGFGLLVSAEGDVVTHVSALGGRDTLRAELPNGNSTQARVVAYEPESGLVLVRLASAAETPAPPIASARPAPGELAVAAARLGRQEFVAPVFVASAGADRYSISAASGIVVPGTPLFNMDGAAIAVAAGTPSISVAYALGPAVARLVALARSPRALPASIGAVLQPLSPALAERFGSGAGLVCDLRPGGPAHRAGVKVGEVLLRVGDATPDGVEAASRAIAGLRAGSPAVIELRDARGRTRSVEVTPETALTPHHANHSAAPPRAPAAQLLFSEADLSEAGVPTEARVLSVEGEPPAGDALGPRARRTSPPHLLYVYSGGRRFFALVGTAP